VRLSIKVKKTKYGDAEKEGGTGLRLLVISRRGGEDGVHGSALTCCLKELD
jgi:hypothetical protein